MTPERPFTAINLLAAYGEPELLDIVLQVPAFFRLIDEPDSELYDRVRPLRGAIIPGRVDICRVLLDYGLDYRRVCNGIHAIYVCAQV